MNETRKKILDEAQDLMQTRGYAEMTFQEIATRVGIKKPSIVHHFPSKAELAAVVIDRYHRQFIRAMQDIAKDSSQGAWDCLEFYFNPYRHFAKTENLVCLSGALLGEFQILPQEVQKLCKEFYNWHQNWLSELLRQGRNSRQFHFKEEPRFMARQIFSSLQGALLIYRASKEADQLEDVIKSIRASLKLKH